MEDLMIERGPMVEALARWAPGAIPFAQGHRWDWGWHPMWGPWGIVMMLMMLVFWGAVLVGVVLVIRWLVRQGQGVRPDAALDILRQRYARGEINRDEFEAKKRDLAS
jgi:putative membrane protein